jgi:hypothetical protein
MARRDPIATMMMRASYRHANAARTVAVLQAALAREIVAPNPGAMRDRLESTLAERISERNAALQALEDLQCRPRWQLEQLVAAETVRQN